MRKLSVLALFAALCSPVFAQSVTGNGQPVNWPLSTIRNVTQLQGTPVNPANVTRFNWPAAGGGLFVDATVRIPQPNGQSLSVVPRASVSTAAVGAAIGNFAKKVVPAIVVASAFKDLATDLGFFVKDQNGILVIERPDPAICSVGPCFQWGPPAGLGPWFPSQSAGCVHTVLTRFPGSNITNIRPDPASFNNCHYTFTRSDGVVFNNERQDVANRQVAPSPGVNVPSSVDEVIQTLNTNPPSNSQSLLDATIQAINSGESLATDAPTSITGPATTPGPVSTTTNTTNNTTTTTTTTNNHTYSGPTVTTTTTTTVVTIDNLTNQVTDSTTTTDQPLLPQPQPDSEPVPFELPCGVAGKPPCDVKVDETGMKTPDQIKNDQADDTLDEWDSFVTDIIAALPAFPTIAWDFALPTACGVIPLPAFSPMIESIDVCQFQPMFHELMTVVWTLGGLFGAISLFMRSSLSN